jgi:CRISPR-associated exonuclease Cas4
MVEMITGTMVQGYYICSRQVWLMSRQIIPEQDHPFIEMGRLIDEDSFQREKKKIRYENLVLDFVKSEGEEMVIGEVKKSSRAEKSARLQLLFYLYRLEQKGINARGVLSFPEERRRVPVELGDKERQELEQVFAGIKKIIGRERPPVRNKIGFCRHCGYRGFCWS